MISNNKRESSKRWMPVVEIDFGAAYEFITFLSVFWDDHCDYEIGSSWFEALRKKASPDLLLNLDRFTLNAESTGDWCLGWSHLLGLVYECSPPKDVPTLLTYIESLDPLELRLDLLGYYDRDFRKLLPLDVILQTASGNQGALEHYFKATFPDDPRWQEKVRYLLSLDLETMKSMFLDMLRGWYEQIFCEHEQAILPILERDAEAKRLLKQTTTLERLIETATNGIAYISEPGLRRVVLVPSFIQRPWNETADYLDMRIYSYPVADEFVSSDSSMPPFNLVRVYKALADERRLRILKLLIVRDYSLQEIADELGAAKSTLHHHVSTLRAAGLLRIHTKDKLYSLRHDKLAKVAGLLDAYLRGSSS